MRKAQKRKRLYGGMLKDKGKVMDKKGLYKRDKDGRVKPLDELEVRDDKGVSFRITKELYEKTHKDLLAYREKIDIALDKLNVFLDSNGYKLESIEIDNAIDELENVLTISPYKQYDLFLFNDRGYIKNALVIDGKIAEHVSLPVDIDKGYYKFVDGKIVLDKEEQARVWSVA